MKLYSLSEDNIRDLLAQEDLIQGKNEILKDQSSGKTVIKIVVVVEENKKVVITAYPLKGGRDF